MNALLREIEVSPPGESASIFFGGGTPSLIAPAELARVLDALGNHFAVAPDVEITLEANPDDVTPGLADAWLARGVNRVSLGIQSFNDDALAYLGRRHDADAARNACRIIRSRFANWNMDLMFGVPPYDAWPATLDETMHWAPPHVSAYGLTYEPGTPFGKRANEAIDEDAYLHQYHLAVDRFAPLARYEVSNFARPGFECRHNLVYWRNGEYAGFGPGAYSFLGGVRARNHASLESYLSDPGGKIEALQLSGNEIRLETVIQHLRLTSGLLRAEYERRFGAPVEADFGEALADLRARGLIKELPDRIVPTELGFDLNNEIGLALVPPSPARLARC
jgi:oxygen-independent coproporphyrinogen-3 oxidase